MLFFGRTQENLVNQLSRDGVISESRVKRAMLAVDRALYVDNEYSEGVAYMDEPLPLGQTSETISAPHMHGVALEFLQSRIGPGARVLDVGAGSGYLTACFGELAKPDGYVLGIEKHKSLTDRAIQNIRIANPDLLDNGIVEIIHGNIYSNILDEYEGFDAIHVGAAAESMPQVLIDKLNDDGLMLIPIGPTSYFQQLKLVRKKDGEVEFKDGTHVRYVPLTQPEQSQRNTSSLQ